MSDPGTSALCAGRHVSTVPVDVPRHHKHVADRLTLFVKWGMSMKRGGVTHSSGEEVAVRLCEYVFAKWNFTTVWLNISTQHWHVSTCATLTPRGQMKLVMSDSAVCCEMEGKKKNLALRTHEETLRALEKKNNYGFEHVWLDFWLPEGDIGCYACEVFLGLHPQAEVTCIFQLGP